MLPRERVIDVIEHRMPDRIPIYGWVRWNLEEGINQAFGSTEAFEDQYEFDLAHLFGGPSPYGDVGIESLRQSLGGPVDPAALLDVSLADVDDVRAYTDLTAQIDHHKTDRGRFVYAQTPGIFECLNGVFGIENHLLYLLTFEKELHEVYRRQAEWNRRFALNCLDLGVEMIHVSDDWGGQNALLFSPDIWWRLIHPYHKITCDAVRARGGYLSFHSDGNINQVVDGIIDLGYQVVHPWQESAGMNLAHFKRDYRQAFAVMGGLDVQTTIGFGDRDRLRAEIERVVTMFADGGLIFCTTHFVQEHCSIEELTFAYDLVYDLVRRRG